MKQMKQSVSALMMILAAACGKPESTPAEPDVVDETRFASRRSHIAYEAIADRLVKQMTDITPAEPGPRAVAEDAAITPADAWDKDRFNPKRMVCLAQARTQYLVGYSDPEVIRALLGGPEPLVQDFGFGRSGVPTLIGVTDSVGFRGCTCPPKFEELIVTVLLKDPGFADGEVGVTADTVHVAFLYMSTTHLKRQETIVRKFNVGEQFAGIPADPADESHIGVLRNDDGGVKGLYLKDQDGNIVFKAGRHIGTLPKAELALPGVDYLFYAAGQRTFASSGRAELDLFGLDGHAMRSSYFRVQDVDTRMAFDLRGRPPVSALYVPGNDYWRADRNHDLGRLLEDIDYKAVMWSADEISEGIAWTPPPAAR